MKYYEFFSFLEEGKLTEKKDHIINKMNLTDEQKALAIEFFNKHPNYESELGSKWNKPEEMTWEDLEAVINKPRNTKSQIKKAVKRGIEGLTENVDYIFWGVHDIKDAGTVTMYQPLTWKGSRVLASDQVPPQLNTVFDGYTGARWCISYQKTDNYWLSYKDRNEFLFVFGEDIPTKKLALQIERGEFNIKEATIWDSTDSSISHYSNFSKYNSSLTADDLLSEIDSKIGAAFKAKCIQAEKDFIAEKEEYIKDFLTTEWNTLVEGKDYICYKDLSFGPYGNVTAYIPLNPKSLPCIASNIVAPFVPLDLKWDKDAQKYLEKYGARWQYCGLSRIKYLKDEDELKKAFSNVSLKVNVREFLGNENCFLVLCGDNIPTKKLLCSVSSQAANYSGIIRIENFYDRILKDDAAITEYVDKYELCKKTVEAYYKVGLIPERDNPYIVDETFEQWKKEYINPTTGKIDLDGSLNLDNPRGVRGTPTAIRDLAAMLFDSTKRSVSESTINRLLINSNRLSVDFGTVKGHFSIGDLLSSYKGFPEVIEGDCLLDWYSSTSSSEGIKTPFKDITTKKVGGLLRISNSNYGSNVSLEGLNNIESVGALHILYVDGMDFKYLPKKIVINPRNVAMYDSMFRSTYTIPRTLHRSKDIANHKVADFVNRDISSLENFPPIYVEGDGSNIKTMIDTHNQDVLIKGLQNLVPVVDSIESICVPLTASTIYFLEEDPEYLDKNLITNDACDIYLKSSDTTITALKKNKKLYKALINFAAKRSHKIVYVYEAWDRELLNKMVLNPR